MSLTDSVQSAELCPARTVDAIDEDVSMLHYGLLEIRSPQTLLEV